LIKWSPYEGKTGSYNLDCTFALETEYPPQAPPISLSSEPLEAQGNVTIIGKDGLPNERNVLALRKVLGWDGKLSTFAPEARWEPLPCRVTVGFDEYSNGYRVQWINPADGSRLARRKMNEEEQKELEYKHQANLDAMIAAMDAGGPMPKLAPQPQASVLPLGEVPF